MGPINSKFHYTTFVVVHHGKEGWGQEKRLNSFSFPTKWQQEGGLGIAGSNLQRHDPGRPKRAQEHIGSEAAQGVCRFGL